MRTATPESEVKKELRSLRAKCKHSESRNQEMKEFSRDRNKCKSDLKKLSEYNNELKTRLLSIVEVLEHILPHPTRIEESLSLLHIETYTNYIKIVSYMSEKELSVITSYTIGRYILTELNYKDIEVLLFNLDKLGLISLESGVKYLELTLANKRVKTFQNNGQEKD